MIKTVIQVQLDCNYYTLSPNYFFYRDWSYVVVRMKLTRSGRTVTKPAKFATSGVVDKVNVVTGLVDNKVNVVATMMDRVDDSNVGLVVDKDGNKTGDMLQANQAKPSFLIPVEMQKKSEKATYIVRLPEKTEVERLKEEFMEVEEDVDDPMAQTEQEEQEEKEKEDFSGAGVVYDGSAEENHPEVDNINQFSLTHIPIEVIEEDEGGVDEEEFEDEEEDEEREKTEEEDWQEQEQDGRLSLVRQLGLLQEQQQREEEEISDHVISIEENGHITIEQVSHPISSFSCFTKKWSGARGALSNPPHPAALPRMVETDLLHFPLLPLHRPLGRPLARLQRRRGSARAPAHPRARLPLPHRGAGQCRQGHPGGGRHPLPS